jgi:hypothetical protein
MRTVHPILRFCPRQNAKGIYSRLVDYMFLTCSYFGVYSHSSHPNLRERYLRTLWNVGVGAAPGTGANVALRSREASGFRPARKGLPPKLAGRGQASGAKSPCSGRKAAKSPEERTEAKKSPRRNVERRCRVPLFSGDPGNKPRLLPRCAFRRSASLFSCRGRFSKTPTHAKAFAGGDDACPGEGLP